MSELKKCARCGCSYEKNNTTDLFFKRRVVVTSLCKISDKLNCFCRQDLCDDCFKAFDLFMQNYDVVEKSNEK